MKKYLIPILIQYLEERKEWILPKEISKEYTNEEIKNIIDKHLNEINNDSAECDEEKYIEIIIDGGFQELKIDRQDEIFSILNEYILDKEIHKITIAMEPQYVNKQFLKLLKKYKIKNIKLNIYTCSDYILKRIGSKYNFNDIKKVCRKLRFNRFDLNIKITIGLPESTKIDDINCAKAVIKLKPKYVSIDSIIVLKGSKLEEKLKSNEYKELTVVQAIEISKEIIEIVTKNNIKISEIGYEQKIAFDEQKELAEKIIAGPYHPAYRQLIEGGLWYDAIVSKIKKLNVKVEEVEVRVNSQDLENVIGYKQENINKLKDLYDVDLIVSEDSNIKQGKSKIEITKVYKEFKTE